MAADAVMKLPWTRGFHSCGPPFALANASDLLASLPVSTAARVAIASVADADVAEVQVASVSQSRVALSPHLNRSSGNDVILS
jgi:hypothetical protein